PTSRLLLPRTPSSCSSWPAPMPPSSARPTRLPLSMSSLPASPLPSSTPLPACSLPSSTPLPTCPRPTSPLPSTSPPPPTSPLPSLSPPSPMSPLPPLSPLPSWRTSSGGCMPPRLPGRPPSGMPPRVRRTSGSSRRSSRTCTGSTSSPPTSAPLSWTSLPGLPPRSPPIWTSPLSTRSPLLPASSVRHMTAPPPTSPQPTTVLPPTSPQPTTAPPTSSRPRTRVPRPRSPPCPGRSWPSSPTSSRALLTSTLLLPTSPSEPARAGLMPRTSPPWCPSTPSQWPTLRGAGPTTTTMTTTTTTTTARPTRRPRSGAARARWSPVTTTPRSAATTTCASPRQTRERAGPWTKTCSSTSASRTRSRRPASRSPRCFWSGVAAATRSSPRL
ncbi:hypothetical protein IWQ57_006182, partial [Coemansia nantahalensis]